MAVFFLRTKRAEGIANLYTRVKKRNPYIKWGNTLILALVLT